MRNTLKQFWRKTVEFHTQRFVGLVLSGDEERYRVEFNVIFNETKKLSDFLAMIVRLAFGLFATLYLLQAAKEAEGLYGAMLGISGLWALLITAFLSAKIFQIILLWMFVDGGLPGHRLGKVVVVVVSVASSLTVYVGVQEVVRAVARASDLLSN